MEGERQETYERIPWETLQPAKGDRQWILYVVAGALVAGALAYSFIGNRPAAVPAQTLVESGPAPAAETPVQPITPPVVANPEAATDPLVIAEADLYAVHPERLLDQAVAHAEWFAAEYFTLDGSQAAIDTIGALMPAGVPLPNFDGDTLVFVEWARAISSQELASLTYRVDVLVRWLKSAGDGLYVRQAPLVVSVDVEIGESGPRVMLPPEISAATPAAAARPILAEVPPDVSARAMESTGATEVVGGMQTAVGVWRVVVMAPGPDGVIRPQTVTVG